MRFLDLQQVVRIVVLASAAYACGGADRNFIDDIGSGGQGGSSGQAGSSAGASNDASSTGGRGGGGSAGASGSGGKAGGDASPMTDARGGDASDARDAADSGEMQPPPPPPGRPGLDNTAGGMWMKSTGFKAFVATGETPGYNGLYTSPSFRLRTGVISTTQP